MDREEFQIKLDEINALVEKKDYKGAMEIVDSIDWRRVKNIRMLCTVGEIYAVNKRYENSRDIFLLAYHRASVGKSILYRLIEVSIKMGNTDEALEYYNEFLNVAPNDSTQYVLKYKIYSAKNAPLEEQIAILEEYKEKEYTERWSYELAKLYFQKGDFEKCTEICDDMVIWFGEGKFVNRALDLKKKYTQLTPGQEKAYNRYLHPVAVPVQEKEEVILEEKKEEKPEPAEEKSEEKPEDDKKEQPMEEEALVKEPEEEEKEKKKGRRPLNRMEKAFQAINSIKEDVINVKNEIFSDTSVMDEVAAVVEEEKKEKEKEEVSDEAIALAETIESISQVKPDLGEGEDEIQKKVSDGIMNIFQMKSLSMGELESEAVKEEESQIPGQINISDIIPDAKPVIHEDIPDLESEDILKKPEKLAMPKFEMPKMDLNETAKVEDLPINRDFSFNLEDTILAAATEQGIEIAKDEPEIEEVKIEEVSEAEELSPKEELEPEIEELNLEDVFKEEESQPEDDSKAEEESSEDELGMEEVKDLEFPDEFPDEDEEIKSDAEETLEILKDTAKSEEEEDSGISYLEEEPKMESEITLEEIDSILEASSQEEIKNLEEESVEEVKPLTEEEELMNFIDQKNADPDMEDRDIVTRDLELDDEEVKIFKYFTNVPGMKEQIGEVLRDTQLAAADKTSNTGNVIIMGNKGSGKTMLFDLLIKAICRQLKLPAAKIAKVTASQVNQMDIPKVIRQLAGGFLLIQNVNQMTAEASQALDQALEFKTDGLTVFVEDEKIGMRKFIARNENLMKKFTSRISIPVFTNDELVNFAKVYTTERGYKIEEMAILALYTLISDNQKEDEPMTVEGVRELLDVAIAKADSGTRKLKRNLSKTRTDRDGMVILYEKDFK